MHNLVAIIQNHCQLKELCYPANNVGLLSASKYDMLTPFMLEGMTEYGLVSNLLRKSVENKFIMLIMAGTNIAIKMNRRRLLSLTFFFLDDLHGI